jgi:hypothetical protein
MLLTGLTELTDKKKIQAGIGRDYNTFTKEIGNRET